MINEMVYFVVILRCILKELYYDIKGFILVQKLVVVKKFDIFFDEWKS